MLRVLAALLVLLVFGHGALAARVVVKPPVGADWDRFARTYLWVVPENRLFDPARDRTGLRCIRMNNYGCLWQRAGNWPGTPGPDGTDGAHDGAGGSNGHAIFSHPKWSIVAAFLWFEKRVAQSGGNVTALSLAEVYSPWCDTIGSAGTRADASGKLWGRGCSGGQQPPAGFRGPICAKPQDGKPSRAQCQACNCPDAIATFWLRKTDAGINDSLVLFDAAGKPSDTLKKIIPAKIQFETGRYRPTPELIDEAVQAFTPHQP